MEKALCSANSGDDRDRTHQAGLPDFVGDFALGVGNVKKNHVVVDINGCDNGIALKLSGTGATVIAIDPRETPGSAFCPAPDKDPWFKTGRMPAGSGLPIEPRSVDIVFVDLALHELPAPSLAIMEIKRILKPGGRLVLTDIHKINGDASGETWKDVWTGFYPGDIRHWMKSAGFSNIIVNPVPTRQLCRDTGCPDSQNPVAYLMATGTA